MVLALSLGLFGLLGAAHAQEPADPSLQWSEDWRRVAPWEVAVSSGLMTAGVLVRFVPSQPDGGWTDVPGIDRSVTGALALEDGFGRDAVGYSSDGLYLGALAFSALEPLVVAGAVRGSWDVAAQLEAINFESYAVFAALMFPAQHFARRQRPAGRDGVRDRRSFPGGHLGVVSTAAFATCMHHSRLPLYGSPVADAGACGFWLAGTAWIFVGRIAVEDHYFTDQLTGLGVGFVSGGLVPWLLHYRERPAGRPRKAHVQWIPSVDPDRPGLVVRVVPGG